MWMNALRQAFGSNVKRVAKRATQLDSPERLLRSLLFSFQTLNHDRSLRFHTVHLMVYGSSHDKHKVSRMDPTHPRGPG
jgi:hypothetical protein